MNPMRSLPALRHVRLAVIAAMALVPVVAVPGAQSAAAAPAGDVHVDVEVDPTAYVLDGNSIHVGIGYRRLRLDLGNFGMTIPHALHGADGLTVAFDGYGAKLQWFPLAAADHQTGLHLGVDAAVIREHVHHDGMDLAVRRHLVTTGVLVGYRLDLAGELYATAWLGIGYQWGADPVTLADRTYDPRALTVFPAVHVGYRFR